MRTGAWTGACLAAAAAAEILSANRRTINPASGLALGILCVGAGVVTGLVTGWLGGRATATLRGKAPEGATALAALVTGQLFFPLGFGPLLAALLPFLRWLRRRVLRRVTRLDAAIPMAVAGAAGAWLLHVAPAPPPGPLPVPRTAPVPGSQPVTVSVHAAPGFPDVPAVHLPLRALDAAEPGRRAALWTGNVPDRTRAGRTTPRRLPGGGGVSWIPDRPATRRMLAAFPPARTDDPVFAEPLTLPRLAEAAGIAVLHGPPSPGDPPLHLRILDADSAPDRATAERLRRESAWIDVTLDAERGRVALAGEGISLAPVSAGASLLDVTPTALHLLGLPVPRTCDGRVLLEVMDLDGPGGRPIAYVDVLPPAR